MRYMKTFAYAKSISYLFWMGLKYKIQVEYPILGQNPWNIIWQLNVC